MNSVDMVVNEGNEVTPSHDDTNLIHFEDLNEGVMTGTSRVAMSNSGKYGEANLGEWFKRPILIKTYQWAESVELDDSFDPFVEYFSKDVVKSKLTGYSRMRCDLKLKFVVNATPFQYGMAYAAYKPLSYSKQFYVGPVVTSQAEYDDFSGGIIGRTELVDLFTPYSTRNHIELLPQVNQGGELTIPFCYPGNWFELTPTIFKTPVVSTGWGKVDVVSLTTLRSAAPDAGTDCNITVYAWCENIELTGPANIEFQAGKVSSMLSTFTEVADGVGSTMTFLRPYTSVIGGIAGGIATIAKLLGHTPNYNTKPAARTALVTNPCLAEGNDGFEVHNLQLTSQNAIPIDPTDTGCPMVDEMEMGYVLSKPVFVTYSDWSSSVPSGVTIMKVNVSPEIFNKTSRIGVNSGTYYSINQSISSLLSSVHEYWRGTITYHVKVICSQYHRGRLKITFDPTATGVPTDGYQMSKIMDLNETVDCEFEVPWFASTYWLKCQHLALSPSNNNVNVESTMSLPAAIEPVDTTRILGRIYIEVLNELRSPDSTADVMVLVYADTSKLEFAYPIGDPVAEDAMLSNCMEPYQLQADESNHYFGEINKSLRTLCQRSSDYLNYLPNDQGYELWQCLVPRIPSGRGPVEVSAPTAYSEPYFNGTFISNTATVNGLINSLTYPSLFYPCYVGQRGSYVWRVHKPSFGGNLNNVITIAYRWYKNVGDKTCYLLQTIATNVNERFNPGLSGMVKASGVNETFISFRAQSFIPFKFASCNPMASYNQKLVDAQDNLSFISRAVSRGGASTNGLGTTIQNLMVAAGDDWTCFGFLNVPTMYVIDTSSGGITAKATFGFAT